MVALGLTAPPMSAYDSAIAAGSDLRFSLVQAVGGVRIVRVSGEIDVATAEQLVLYLAGVPTGDTSDVVADLRDVTFVDSSGMGAFLRAHAELEGRGVRLRLRHLAPRVERAFRLTALDRALRIED